ncbi:hypothetical protein [uncultured Sulfitobacter sp.]|uniref:hypothetical protein n=1 Tax=uncultured Sulfitobacter sp. TaxID=191468 RepID=UPI002611968F|nr:hypothetical protein [uncultured Sulfitobacter sp.]
MTDLKMNTARAVLIAMIAAAPMSLAAQPVSGSPEQSVQEHPRETAEPRATFSSSNTEPLYDSFDKADVVESQKGSLHSGDARSKE